MENPPCIPNAPCGPAARASAAVPSPSVSQYSDAAPTGDGDGASHACPLLGNCICHHACHHHLRGPGLPLLRFAGDPPRPRPVAGADGLGFRRLRSGLCPVRAAGRIPGRLARPAPGAAAHRGLVVVLHRRHRLRFQPGLPHHHPVPVRCRGGRLLPQSHQGLHHLAAAGGKDPRPGLHVAGRPLGRRLHPAGCPPDHAPRRLA